MTEEKRADLHRQWLEAIGPITRLKANFMQLGQPRAGIHDDGTLESLPPSYSPEVQEVLRFCDERLASLTAYFGELMGSPPTA